MESEEAIVEAFSAFGHPMRAKILRFLKLNLPNGAKYRSIAEKFGKRGGALDYHLNKLKKPGLVRCKKGTYHVENLGLRLLEILDELLIR